MRVCAIKHQILRRMKQRIAPRRIDISFYSFSRRSVWGKHSAWKSTPEIGGGFLAQNRAEARRQCRSHFIINDTKGVFHWEEHKQKHLHFG